jgi:hypothetical protein
MGFGPERTLCVMTISTVQRNGLSCHRGLVRTLDSRIQVECEPGNCTWVEICREVLPYLPNFGPLYSSVTLRSTAYTASHPTLQNSLTVR